MSTSSDLQHGGRLRAAAHDFRIPLQHWLDLSTGINPAGWPVPALPAEVWRRLPEDDDGLAMASLACFGGQRVLPLAGSQAAIQALPQLFTPRRVGILSPCYAEHLKAWLGAGHQVESIAYADAEQAVERLDVLLLTNPNNPTGHVVPPATLRTWHSRLAARGGLLVVDEAFIDPTPDTATSFAERQRLFDAVAGWDQYDSALISEGGGIFLRSAKSIPISPEMQARFDIQADKLPPTELLNALLKAPVDLL